MENLAKMSEVKCACLYFGEKYCNSKTKNAALLDARKVFQKEFREKLGIKYYVPDPKGSLKNMWHYRFIWENVYLKTISAELISNMISFDSYFLQLLLGVTW